MPHALFVITPRVRMAMLKTLSGLGADAERVVTEVGRRRGFSTLGELIDFVAESYGEAAMQQFAERFERIATDGTRATPFGRSRSTRLTEIAAPALVAVPDGLFLLAAEFGREYVASFTAELGGPDYIQHDFERQVTELFTGNGVPYHFDEEGRLVPTMSPAVVAVAIEPALEALNEPALATAYEHFLQALKRLDEPDPDEAVDEGRQAVEAAMLALLDACGLERPRRRTAQHLFDALAPTEYHAPRAMSRDAEELVLATPRFRNKTSAGHSGGPPVDLAEAQAALAATAASLLYLASKFPAS